METTYVSQIQLAFDPRYRAEFYKFISTGEADDSFMMYLDRDANLQAAAITVFEYQAEAFQALGRDISERRRSLEIEKSTCRSLVSRVVDLIKI